MGRFLSLLLTCLFLLGCTAGFAAAPAQPQAPVVSLVAAEPFASSVFAEPTASFVSPIAAQPQAPAVAPAAAEPVTLAVSSVRGDQVTVELSISGLNWAGLSVQLLYDPARLTLVSLSEGAGIAAARQAGFSFLVQPGDVEQANGSGRCAFVAAVGASECRMSEYPHTAAVFVFRLADLSASHVPVQLAVASLIDGNGTPLTDYTEFAPGQTPAVYREFSLPTYQPGDVDGNGELTVYDALLIQQRLAGLTSLSPRSLAAGQVSGQTELTVYDALLIQQRLAGLIEAFPAQS